MKRLRIRKLKQIVTSLIWIVAECWALVAHTSDPNTLEAEAGSQAGSDEFEDSLVYIVSSVTS